MTRRHIGVIPERQLPAPKPQRRRRSDWDAVVGWALMVLTIGLVVLAMTGCTSREITLWLDWYQTDPDAAVAFANRPDVQAALAARTEQPAPYRAAWDALADCESGGNWAYNGGSGYDGGLQFLPSSWRAYGGGEFASYAWAASREQQIVVAERILADVGWQAWPACSRKLGLR